MARMHSGRRGKSGSKRPVKKVAHSWVRYKPKEVELLVVKLAKEKKAPSQIGMLLRDVYGIPDTKVLAKKSISEILNEKKLLPTLPEDLMAIIKKNIAIRKHLEANPQDKMALLGLQLAESKMGRLVKYYKRTGRMAADWKYDPAKIRLLIE